MTLLSSNTLLGQCHALRARLTEFVGDGVNEIEDIARNAEVNADHAPESESTFGARKGGEMTGTERSEAPAAPQ